MDVDRRTNRTLVAPRELLYFATGYASCVACLLAYGLASGVTGTDRRALITNFIVALSYVMFSSLALPVTRSTDSLRFAKMIAVFAALLETGTVMLFRMSDEPVVWLMGALSIVFVLLLGIWSLRWWRRSREPPELEGASDDPCDAPGRLKSRSFGGGRPPWSEVSPEGKCAILATHTICLAAVMGAGYVLVCTSFLDWVPGGGLLLVQGLILGVVGCAYLVIQVCLARLWRRLGILAMSEMQWFPLSGTAQSDGLSDGEE